MMKLAIVFVSLLSSALVATMFGVTNEGKRPSQNQVDAGDVRGDLHREHGFRLGNQSKSYVETNPNSSNHVGGVVPPLKLPAITSTSTWSRPRARGEPHGHIECASGCTVSHHPTPRLSVSQCRDLLAEYQQVPFDQQSAALDALLYYGVQTRYRLRDKTLPRLLDKQHLQFLQRELSRERAVVAIRLVDQFGQVRAQLPPTKVPQHERQVFEFDVWDLQPLICSGTVKRVGKNHVWQRL